MKEAKVVNRMADGSSCEDLSTYLGPEHLLPEDAKRLIWNFIREGRAIRKAKG